MNLRKTPLLFFAFACGLFLFAAPTASLAQATYYNMTAGDYSQDFAGITNTAVWATPTTGSWQGLATNATGSVPSATRITASTTNFQTNASSGGVQRGAGNMQLLSTGSTDNTSSTAIDLLLNFSGRNAGTLSFDAASVFNATGNRVGTLRVYYTVDSSTWSEITGGGLPYAATNNVAGSTAVSVSLPAAINNSPSVQLRYYYNNGSGGTTGSRPKISIDNVLVTSTPAVAGAPVITSGTTSSVVAYVATANIYQITASNSPDSYAATGLPAGLSIDTSTGIISGAATNPGVYSVAITATNSQGTGGATLTLTVSKNPGAPTITSPLTATGLVADPSFSYAIVADNSPTAYAAGTLPPGLTIDTGTGLISGTPTAGGVFNVPVTASNALGSDTQTLVLTINSAPVITSPLSGSLYVGNSFAYSIGANFSPSFYGASNLPSGWGIDVATGAISNGTTPLLAGATAFQISAINAYGADTETYTLQVFDQVAQDAVPLNVVVNKYVNGTPDKVQLLVVGNGTPGSTVDMRGMIIKDFSSSMANDGGGKFVFTDNAIWSAVPAGTFVTLSAGTTQSEDIDPADFYLAVNLGNPTYFTNGGGSFDIATTDMLLLKSAGSGVSGVAGGIHALAGGTAGAQFTAYTGAKLRASGTSGTDLGVMALNSTSQLSDYGAAGQPESTDAQGGQAAASLNFASWNSPGNESYVKILRGIIDGTGTASITNADGASDFFGQNIFGRNLTEQSVAISYTAASASTAITALEITVPSEMGAPSAGNIALEGSGTESAAVSVAGQVISITGLNALNPDPVNITVGGLVTPDTAASVSISGRYTFAIKSSGGGGTPAPLGSSPAAVVVIPIANARNADPVTFVPVLLGQTVAVEGVANVAKLGTGQINSALQDATHGITIFSSTVANLPIRGNRYIVSGALAQFNGLVQINISNPGLISDLGAAGDPAPVTVSVADFNTNGIALQSRVVRIENLSYVSGTWAPNQNVVLQDSASNQLTVRIQANSTATSPPTYPATITGIAGQFDNSSPFNTGFQLQPRDQADAPVQAPVINSPLTADATEGTAFSYQITTTANPPATSYSASPLPTGLTVDTATGLISGTPSVDGTFNVTITATNAGGTDIEILVLTVQSGGGTAYDTWASGFGLNPATNGAPAADPDGDSFSNAQEFAFGTNPTQGNAALTQTSLSGGNLTVTYLERNSGVTYAVRNTTNLAAGPWNPASVTPSTAPDQAGVPTGYTRKQFSVPATGSGFYRVTATTTP